MLGKHSLKIEISVCLSANGFWFSQKTEMKDPISFWGNRERERERSEYNSTEWNIIFVNIYVKLYVQKHRTLNAVYFIVICKMTMLHSPLNGE